MYEPKTILIITSIDYTGRVELPQCDHIFKFLNTKHEGLAI